MGNSVQTSIMHLYFDKRLFEPIKRCSSSTKLLLANLSIVLSVQQSKVNHKIVAASLNSKLTLE